MPSASPCMPVQHSMYAYATHVELASPVKRALQARRPYGSGYFGTRCPKLQVCVAFTHCTRAFLLLCACCRCPQWTRCHPCNQQQQQQEALLLALLVLLLHLLLPMLLLTMRLLVVHPGLLLLVLPLMLLLLVLHPLLVRPLVWRLPLVLVLMLLLTLSLVLFLVLLLPHELWTSKW